ncbi:YihY/virulence factor BrkB family protein [Ectothiorhodospiraceae bacterium 2226]|nr:YihY/virulence factor BrkB family protein [Ectothiorhodospiraceae bacterium 2226]
MADDDAAARGRGARAPKDIPRKGWRDVGLRVKSQISENNLSIIAAGVAFYALFAIFPALAALVSIYGIAFDPADVQELVENLQMVPADTRELILEQLSEVTEASGAALGLGALIGLAIALWGAMRGVYATMIALNVVYGEQESRGMIRLYGTALLLTLVLILVLLAALATIVVVPIMFAVVGWEGIGQTLISIVRWPLLGLAVVLALGVLYRYGPDRRNPQKRWVTWGAVLATVLWLIGSWAFSFYVQNFGDYNETYGSLGAVIVMLMWLWVTAFIALLGATLNAEMEHQTRHDTTVGDERALGDREAHVADTVGERP